MADGIAVPVGGTAVFVRVAVTVFVGTAVGGTAVFVRVAVAVFVGTAVGGTGVLVWVAVAVRVAVAVAAPVAVGGGAPVDTEVGVAVGEPLTRVMLSLAEVVVPPVRISAYTVCVPRPAGSVQARSLLKVCQAPHGSLSLCSRISVQAPYMYRLTAVDVVVPPSRLMTRGYTAALRPKSCVQ